MRFAAGCPLRCWLYLGHSSEIANNCDFLTRAVGGCELIFNRDRAGVVRAFFNTCPHRGAMEVREKKGNALSFRCFYHGWSFNVNGRRFAPRLEEGKYGKEHYGGGCADLVQVTPAGELPRLLVRELRQESDVAWRLSGRRQGIYRSRGRPF